MTTTQTSIDWTSALVDQAARHWTNQLRPRYEGLTDDDYLCEPTPGAWNDLDYLTFDYAGTADEALAQVDAAFAAWTAGARGWDEEALAEPCGPSEGPWAEHPRVELVLHINRELIHHGAEIALLRDLYAHRND